MPTISRFHGIVIEMYWNDHEAPHFHAFAAGQTGSDRTVEIIACNHRIVDVQVLRFGLVALTFDDGLRGEVDLSGHIWGPVFERVRTPEGFKEVYIDEEGGTIAWPGEVDLAPDTLYIKVKTGEWPPGLDDARPTEE